jgi:ureidoacrylate peracid hydrolase
MSAAVIVVDMQNGFLHPKGSFRRLGHGLPNIECVIEQHQLLLQEARQIGLSVLYTRHNHRPDHLDAPRLVSQQARALGALVLGSWDAAVIDELAPAANDTTIDKFRYDAFLYTPMEVMLRALQISSLLITGVATHACVESTARSADMRDFDVAVAADCTSAPEGLHHPALATMEALGIRIGPWRELLADVAGKALAVP